MTLGTQVTPMPMTGTEPPLCSMALGWTLRHGKEAEGNNASLASGLGLDSPRPGLPTPRYL